MPKLTSVLMIFDVLIKRVCEVRQHCPALTELRCLRCFTGKIKILFWVLQEYKECEVSTQVQNGRQGGASD